MIVVAIIGILAAVAIPAYSDYTVKAKVANAMSAAGSLKTAIALCGQENGDVAKCNSTDTPTLPTFTVTKEVSGATITGAGVITLTLADIGKDTKDTTIIMTPTLGTSAMTWKNVASTANTAAKAAIEKNNSGT